MPIQAVEPRRLYRQIAEQLRGLIRAGEWVVGTRLPAERELAQQLGVSRPSVREALIALEVEGWVEVRTGSGVYVLDRPQPGPALSPTEWGPLELLRARRLVEGETAAMAATQAKRQHLSAMRQALRSMAAEVERGIMPQAGDRAFHSAVVEACDNMVLTDTLHHLWDSRSGPLFERLGSHFETLDSWRLALAEHQAIYDAIAAHDAAAARAAMHHHLDQSHRRFNASWQRPARSGPRLNRPARPSKATP